MAYADRDTTGSRIVAIVVCSLIVAAFGYAFVTGLASSIAKKVTEKLNTFDVAPPPPPPPPDKPPPPPPDQPNLPPPPTAPVVPPQLPPLPAVNTITTSTKPAPITYDPPPPTPQPAPQPAPPRVAVPVSARGDQASWFPLDSYPSAARRAGAEGRVTVRVGVGTNGRVTSCEVVSSSGNGDLDSTTCSLAKRNARFNPAKDPSGQPIESTFTIRGVRWQLQNE